MRESHISRCSRRSSRTSGLKSGRQKDDLVLDFKNSDSFAIVLMKKKSSEAWPYRGCNKLRINSGKSRTVPDRRYQQCMENSMN